MGGTTDMIGYAPFATGSTALWTNIQGKCNAKARSPQSFSGS
jgi:hypothetical protein